MNGCDLTDLWYVCVPRCDLYEDTPASEQEHLIDGFLRFIEIMNKIRRPAQSRKPKVTCFSLS